MTLRTDIQTAIMLSERKQKPSWERKPSREQKPSREALIAKGEERKRKRHISMPTQETSRKRQRQSSLESTVNDIEEEKRKALADAIWAAADSEIEFVTRSKEPINRSKFTNRSEYTNRADKWSDSGYYSNDDNCNRDNRDNRDGSAEARPARIKSWQWANQREVFGGKYYPGCTPILEKEAAKAASSSGEKQLAMESDESDIDVDSHTADNHRAGDENSVNCESEGIGDIKWFVTIYEEAERSGISLLSDLQGEPSEITTGLEFYEQYFS